MTGNHNVFQLEHHNKNIDLCNSRKFGVADYYGSKEGVSFRLYEWAGEGIPEGNIIGTDLGRNE